MLSKKSFTVYPCLKLPPGWRYIKRQLHYITKGLSQDCHNLRTTGSPRNYKN